MTTRITLSPLPIPYSWKMHPHFDPERSLTTPFDMATLAYCDRFKLYDSEEQRARLARVECSRLAA